MADRSTEPIEPMTLGNMRRLGVRSIAVACMVCRHEATVSAEPWPDDVPAPTFGPRMVCTNCGSSAPTRGRIGWSIGRKGPVRRRSEALSRLGRSGERTPERYAQNPTEVGAWRAGRCGLSDGLAGNRHVWH